MTPWLRALVIPCWCEVARLERVLSHLLNSSFAAAPLILPSSIAAREDTHSLVNPSSSPLIYARRVGAAGGGRWARGAIDVRTPLLCAGELRASRLSFC